MLRMDERKFMKAGVVGLKLMTLSSESAKRAHDEVGKAATELEEAGRQQEAATAAHAAARRAIAQSPRNLSVMLRGVVYLMKVLRPDLEMPQASLYDLADPTVYVEEVACALDGQGTFARTLASGLRRAAAQRVGQLETLEGAWVQLQAATRRHHAAGKELAAALTKAEAVVARSMPKEAYARRFKPTVPVHRKRLPRPPEAPAPESEAAPSPASEPAGSQASAVA